MLSKGTIFDVQRYCIHDGPGIRTTVFFKGCPLDCWWCHNPESKRVGREMIFWRQKCIGCGACATVCPQAADITHGEAEPPFDLAQCDLYEKCAGVCPTEAMELVGRDITAEDLMKELRKDIVFYDESGGGVTFSGGEPLMQASFLLDLLQRCHREGIHTAVDTSGHAAWKDMQRVAAQTDLFLYDLKVMDCQKHVELTGVSNELTLGNLEKLAGVHRRIRVRFPLIPGYTDGEDDLKEMACWLVAVGLHNLDLLPYHRTGMDKYKRLGMQYRLETLFPPSEKRVEAVRDLLVGFGLSVKIGG